MTRLQELKMLPLSQAWLCQDCNVVSNGGGICPMCGGTSGEYIVKWLDRLTRKESDAGPGTEASRSRI